MFIISLIIHKSTGGVLMNRLYCVGFLLLGFIFSQCADMNKLDCMLSQDCNWDENMVTGNLCPLGVYVWNIQLTDIINSEDKKFIGNVTLLR